MNLLSDNDLERSAVVANCRMNRERSLTGGNGYARELGFNPFDRLKERWLKAGSASWLDLCCGSGLALIETARLATQQGIADRIEIVGVDLVGMFPPMPDEAKCLRLVEASLSGWCPDREFDLITCVHGLHYIGDKLDLIARAVTWLTGDGFFSATLDLNNIRFANGSLANRVVAAELRRQSLRYDSRRKRVECDGRKAINFGFQYQGADADAGPNFSGQPAVDAYYTARGQE
jgi:SAM-dependent methyltransferase